MHRLVRNFDDMDLLWCIFGGCSDDVDGIGTLNVCSAKSGCRR